MITATIRRNLSEPGLPLNGHLRGIVDVGETPVVNGMIFWRWEDEPDMKEEFLCYAKPGETANVPFDPKGREMRFRYVGITEKGLFNVSDLRNAPTATFNPTASRPADAGLTHPQVMARTI